MKPIFDKLDEDELLEYAKEIIITRDIPNAMKLVLLIYEHGCDNQRCGLSGHK